MVSWATWVGLVWVGWAAGVDHLESFVLAGNRSDVGQFFIPGTEDFLYYRLLSLINSGQADSTDFSTLLASYESQGDYSSVQKLKLRALLSRWDSPKTPTQQRQLLESLNRDFLYYDLSGSRMSQPVNPSSAERYPSQLPVVSPSLPDLVYTDYWAFSQLKPVRDYTGCIQLAGRCTLPGLHATFVPGQGGTE